MTERPIIVFDVNETLLDLDAIQPVFDRIFGDPAAMRLWFANLITYSEALTLAGVYVPFTDIGAAVLRMLAATRDLTVSDSDGAELTNRFATMPPHPEVPAALRRLRDHGFRLFTLTDNTLAISGRQLEHAGVIDLFERRFSVDETVRRHKPAPEAYHSVGTALKVDPGGICLIASHVWDTIGAGAAGWQAALILRQGNAPLDVGPQPDYIGKDLDAIAGAETARRLKIGLADTLLPQLIGTDRADVVHDDPFRKAFLRLKSDRDLYLESSNAVTFLTPTLYRTSIPLPAEVPVGDYDVDVKLFADGNMIARTSSAFEVIKVGFEQFVASAARDYGMIYGLATAIMALFTGWFASVVFSRD